jgi:hypothetical protein
MSATRTENSQLAYRTLLRAVSDLTPGTYVYADTVREAFDAAALTSAERSGAFKSACHDGYLRGIHTVLPTGEVAAMHIRSRHEDRKSGWSLLYRRTGKPVPEHPCREVAT